MSTQNAARELEQLRRLIIDGQLPKRTDGGYPVIYLDNEGETLCSKCATDLHKQDLRTDATAPDVISHQVEGFFIHYEGPPEDCGRCNVLIPSAYGEPEDAQQEAK